MAATNRTQGDAGERTSIRILLDGVEPLCPSAPAEEVLAIALQMRGRSEKASIQFRRALGNARTTLGNMIEWNDRQWKSLELPLMLKVTMRAVVLCSQNERTKEATSSPVRRQLKEKDPMKWLSMEYNEGM